MVKAVYVFLESKKVEQIRHVKKLVKEHNTDKEVSFFFFTNIADYIDRISYGLDPNIRILYISYEDRSVETMSSFVETTRDYDHMFESLILIYILKDTNNKKIQQTLSQSLTFTSDNMNNLFVMSKQVLSLKNVLNNIRHDAFLSSYKLTSTVHFKSIVSDQVYEELS